MLGLLKQSYDKDTVMGKSRIYRNAIQANSYQYDIGLFSRTNGTLILFPFLYIENRKIFKKIEKLRVSWKYM